jgi:hypothetical protein
MSTNTRSNGSLMKGSGGKPWGRRKSVLHFSRESFYIPGEA